MKRSTDWRRRAANLLRVCASADARGRVGAARSKDFVRLVLYAGELVSDTDELENTFYSGVADLMTRSKVQSLRRDTDSRRRNRLFGEARKKATLARNNAQRSQGPARRVLRKMRLGTATTADVQPLGQHLAHLVRAKSAERFAEDREVRLYGDRRGSSPPGARSARGPRRQRQSPGSPQSGLLANPRALVLEHFVRPLYLLIVAASGGEPDTWDDRVHAARHALAIARAYFGNVPLRSVRPGDVLRRINADRN